MRVVLLGQAEMAVGRGTVASLFQAAQEADPQGVGLRVLLDLAQDAVEILPVAQVAGVDTEGFQVIGKFIQLVGIRFVVDAVNAGQVAVVKGARDADE